MIIVLMMLTKGMNVIIMLMLDNNVDDDDDGDDGGIKTWNQRIRVAESSVLVLHFYLYLVSYLKVFFFNFHTQFLSSVKVYTLKDKSVVFSLTEVNKNAILLLYFLKPLRNYLELDFECGNERYSFLSP